MINKTSAFLMLPLLLLARPASVSAQAEEGLIREITFQAGAGFEYVRRTLAWDDREETSDLKSMLFTFRPSVEINQRISLGAVLGYSLTDYGALTFRDLPLSLELEQGNQGGWIFGGALEAALMERGDFEIGVQGEYVYYKGKEDVLEIPGLPVDGTVSTTPRWQRIRAGVKITYIPYAYFYPYVRLSYDHLWGRYEVQEDILDLSGTQQGDLTGRGRFNAGIGLLYEPLDRLVVSGELGINPHSERIDLGFSAGLSYRF